MVDAENSTTALDTHLMVRQERREADGTYVIELKVPDQCFAAAFNVVGFREDLQVGFAYAQHGDWASFYVSCGDRAALGLVVMDILDAVVEQQTAS